MIGSGNFGPAFVIQEDYPVKSPQSSSTILRTNAAASTLIQQSIDTETNKQHQPHETAREAETELDSDSNQVKINSS